MLTIAAAGASFELVPIPAGEFLMGSDSPAFPESPPHPVRIRRGFLLGRSAVTQAQWQAVMGANPSRAGVGPDHPVDSVSWDHAVEFCDRLSAMCGRRVRLPSEAEWEYACRAGSTGDFHFGPWGPIVDETRVPRAALACLVEYAWFELNSGGRTRPVGSKRPNPWDLNDMLGNVWEWCADVWHEDYAHGPYDEVPWSEGPETQPRRVLRGAAWDMDAFRCRSAYRSYDHRSLATDRFGLRIVVEAS